MTTQLRLGSAFFCAVVCMTCRTSHADLGVCDKGIWSDLDAQVQLDLPAHLSSDRVTAISDKQESLRGTMRLVGGMTVCL